jgi:hypothetical protein
MPISVSGHNGMNETRIGLSSSVGLQFFDENGPEIIVANSKDPIEVWVERDVNKSTNLFQTMDVFNLNLSANNQFIPNGFNITSNNASMHIQIRPSSPSVGYLLLVKLGDTPAYNSSYMFFDYWKLLCPGSSDYVVSGINSPYYLYFLDMEKLEGFKGFVGYAIRELTNIEIQEYCQSNLYNLTMPPLIEGPSNFTVDFAVRAVASGCYFYCTNTNRWRWSGMNTYADSDDALLHCQSTHLTEFAGGFLVLPSSINFQYVWANAGFVRNAIIYSTVILITSLYVLFAIWARYMDRKDSKRLGITMLDNNMPEEDYFYEIITFTGNRTEASTDSKVSLLINYAFFDIFSNFLLKI